MLQKKNNIVHLKDTEVHWQKQQFYQAEHLKTTTIQFGGSLRVGGGASCVSYVLTPNLAWNVPTHHISSGIYAVYACYFA